MDITLFGYMWIILSIICIFVNIKYTVLLLMFSCVMQASAVIILNGDIAIAPWIISSIVFIFKNLLIGIDRSKPSKIEKSIIIFYFFVLFITVIDLIIFKGTMVPLKYNKINGWTAVSVDYTGLKLTTLHITNFIILTLFVLDAILLIKNHKKIDIKFILDKFKYIVYFVLIVGAIQFIITNLGFSKVLLKLFIYSDYSSTAISIDRDNASLRLFSTFSEPSYCACFLSAIFWYYLYKNRGKIKFLHFIILVEIVLTFSPTGYGSFCIGLAIYLLLSRNITTIITTTIFIIVFITLSLIFGYGTKLISTIMNKSSSISGIERAEWNRQTFSIFIKTFGFGVGFSSIRSSSLFINLLGQIGVIGTIAYFYMIFTLSYNIFSNKSISHKSSSILLIMIVVGQIISCPDIFFTVFWLVIFVVICEHSFENNDRNIFSNNYKIKRKVL